MSIMERLQAPFDPSDLEWRVQRAMKTQKGNMAIVLAYVTNRAIMNRLDDIFGVDGWRNEYKEWRDKGVLCGISVKMNDEWITKWDGSDETNIEATKGGFSGSMKRAAVQFGIGRYLYNLDETWVQIKESGENYINTKVKSNGRDEWIKGYWDTPKLPAWAMPNSNKQQQISKDTLRAKWITLAGNDSGFDEYYNKKISEGHSEAAIDNFLNAKLQEKNK